MLPVIALWLLIGAVSGYPYQADPGMGTCQLYNGSNVPCRNPSLSYQQLKAAKGLWSCGSFNEPEAEAMCYRDPGGAYCKDLAKAGGECKPDAIPSPGFCDPYGKNFPNVCCVANAGSRPPARFNWVLSTCRGKGATNQGCPPDFHSPSESVKNAKDAGTELIVNYVAAYQYDPGTKSWRLQPDSSFNTNGSMPACDVTKQNCGAASPDGNWLPGPLPGGAAFWRWGFYPAGSRGVGPGVKRELGMASNDTTAMAFVLSADQAFNFAFYIMNQATLDRGPANAYPKEECPMGNANCWATDNSGEWDLLESGWTGVDYAGNQDYDLLYATLNNQGAVGRCLFPSAGVKGEGTGGFGSCKVTRGTKSGQVSPRLFVGIIDKVGTYVYSMPAGKDDTHWQGLTRTTAASVLPHRPRADPASSPCLDPSKLCSVFLPSVPTSDRDEVKNHFGTGLGYDHGFCGNFQNDQLADTQQQWGKEPAEIPGFGKLPWTLEMEGQCGQPTPPPAPPPPPLSLIHI